MNLLVPVALLLAVVLFRIAMRHAQRRRVANRQIENWADTLEHAERALAEYQQEVVPLLCILVTGYAVADEPTATVLIDWVQRETGERTKRWAESDPTFGPYWVVETRTEPVAVTSRLAGRWVARMRLTCEHAGCRLHHFAAFVSGAPPTDTVASYAE